MLSDYAYSLPMIILVIFIEYRKKLFLREANMKEVAIRNIKPNLIRLKTFSYYGFVMLFTLLYKDAALAIRDNVDPKYIGLLISSFVLVFMIMSVFFLRMNNDFYIKENVIHFIYNGNVSIPEGVEVEEVSIVRSYSTVYLKGNSELMGKRLRIKLHIYSENYELFEKYMSLAVRS